MLLAVRCGSIPIRLEVGGWLEGWRKDGWGWRVGEGLEGCRAGGLERGGLEG